MNTLAGMGKYVLKINGEEIRITTGVEDEIGAKFVKIKLYDSFSKYVDYMGMVGKTFELKLTHAIYGCSNVSVKETASNKVGEVDHELSATLYDVILKSGSEDFSTIELVFEVCDEMKITERRG